MNKKIKIIVIRLIILAVIAIGLTINKKIAQHRADKAIIEFNKI
jgi:uncharacterized membrane-anchored protein